MFPAKVLHESSGSFIRPYLLSKGSTEPVWRRSGASVVENSHGGESKQDSCAVRVATGYARERRAAIATEAETVHVNEF